MQNGHYRKMGLARTYDPFRLDQGYIQMMRTPDPTLRRERWKLTARLARALEAPMLILNGLWLMVGPPFHAAGAERSTTMCVAHRAAFPR
jgi:hypothetical protein